MPRVPAETARNLAVPALVAAMLPACSDGYVDGEVEFTLNADNLPYFEDVLYPREARSDWEDALAASNSYVDFRVSYRTERVGAIITQAGDLQITSHLEMGDRYREHASAGDLDEEYEYLLDPQYNEDQGMLSEDEPYAPGSTLYGALAEGLTADYFELDEDIRLVLVINLPDDPDALEESWGGSAEYPKQLRSNALYTDEDGLRLSEEEVELAAFLMVGRQQFDADYDAASDHVDVVVDRFVHPDDQDDAEDDVTRGTVTATFTDPTLAIIGGHARIEADFEVVVRTDPWGLDQPEVEEEIAAER